jgi:hypothetical protein
MTGHISAYREAEHRFEGRPDEFWEFLERNRREDPTLAIGWAVMRARRFYGWDQVTIAQRTEIKDARGHVIEEPISKTFVSSLLSGKSNALPLTYLRLARATEVSPIEFYLAEQWLDPADVIAFSMPDKETALPVLQKLLSIPEKSRPKARAVALAVLDSVYEVETANEPPTPVGEMAPRNARSLERTGSAAPEPNPRRGKSRKKPETT